MVRCHLSAYMGAKKLKIMDVVRSTGLHRTTVTALYQEKAKKVDLEAIEKLCKLFNCGVGDMFEIVDATEDLKIKKEQ
ncbi:MAG: helix-turn-helix transcriptional regulator [Chloroflexi bacterium]|nr:helix-turn-helix transcriptional regulator [Chloroflexota bacterium]